VTVAMAENVVFPAHARMRIERAAGRVRLAGDHREYEETKRWERAERGY